MGRLKKKDNFDQIRKIIEKNDARIHFVGIGGVSMYSLARLALLSSNKISGSDKTVSKRTETLSHLGADVKIGHSADNVKDCDLVVYTHAIADNNPEILAAEQKNIPLVSRAEYLGALMTEYGTGIGISGTHGKSTTVAMLDQILAFADMKQTTLSGAPLVTGELFRVGEKPIMLYEACEYKDSFLCFHPTIAVALNVEYDHPDYFKDFDQVKESFLHSLTRAKIAIVNKDDEGISSLLGSLKGKNVLITVGSKKDADYCYTVTSFLGCGYKFIVNNNGEDLGSFEINIPGIYNVTNAACAIAVAVTMGISPDIIRRALASFNGISGRMERLGIFEGKEVYSDYAHHPTAIRASINSLKMYTKDSITVVFKPHTYSRTKSMFEDFACALSLADHVILTDIYAAREDPIEGVSSERLASIIGDRAVYCPDDRVKEMLREINHGVVVLMGAGDFEFIIKELF